MNHNPGLITYLNKRTRHSTVATFFTAMANFYDDPLRAATDKSTLHTLQQDEPVEDYVVEFCKWSADTGWNDAALKYHFQQVLSEALKDKLARVKAPDSLGNHHKNHHPADVLPARTMF